jgi:hypothetical protein
MVKTNIDVKVHFKAKNVDIEEYELIMNTWRACMLFFERELRKLNDKGKLSTDTLRKISKNLDFTELLRLSFLSIKNEDRMRLVKLDEVAEAIQRVQKLFNTQATPVTRVPPQTTTQEKIFAQPMQQEPEIAHAIPQEQQYAKREETTPLITQSKTNLDFNDPDYDSVKEFDKPDINVHTNILQRNTASAVVELRKMMYENLQKIRNTLAQENK